MTRPCGAAGWKTRAGSRLLWNWRPSDMAVRSARVHTANVHGSTTPAGVPTRDTRPWAEYGRKSKRVAGDGAGASLTRARQSEDNVAFVHRQDERGDGTPVVSYWDNMSGWDPDVT